MDFLRQIVSGPKKRFQEDGYNLDLTYVTPRIIAMSFPASGIETLYRNNIENVSKMIKKKHNGDYMIINLSGRKYDYSKFQDKVYDYQWEDHHSPPINTLFNICDLIDRFLKKKIDNVVIIHCLAGKGRTGTIICCYMIYSGRFQTAQDALLYYGKKRFLQEGLGVNQPCQIRYVYYFHQVFTERNMYPTLKYIQSIELLGRPRFSDDGCRPFIKVFGVNSKQVIFSTAKGYSDQPKFTEGDYFLIDIDNSQPLSGDIIVRFKNNGSISNKNMFRVSFNTAFIKPNNILEFTKFQLSPSEILKDDRFPQDFLIRIMFGNFCSCNCYTPFDKKCSSCQLELDKEAKDWNYIYSTLAKYIKPTLQESSCLLFGKENDDVDEILNKEKKQFVQAKVQLLKGKSSEEDREDLGNVNEFLFEQQSHKNDVQISKDEEDYLDDAIANIALMKQIEENQVNKQTDKQNTPKASQTTGYEEEIKMQDNDTQPKQEVIRQNQELQATQKSIQKSSNNSQILSQKEVFPSDLQEHLLP